MSTQTTHPWRTTARTIIQVGIGLILTLGIVLPIIWGIVEDELAKQGLALPDGVVGIVGASLAVIVAVSGIVARVMAIPQVNDLLTRIGVGAEPKAKPRRAVED